MLSSEQKKHTIHRLVQNKNNLEALFRDRRISAYRKELMSIIRRMEEDRLDWMEFAKQVKFCESDHMPEFDLFHQLIHENPPSPIDLLKLSSTFKQKILPPLPPRGSHYLQDPIEECNNDEGVMVPIRKVYTAPQVQGNEPFLPQVTKNLSRSRTDLYEANTEHSSWQGAGDFTLIKERKTTEGHVDVESTNEGQDVLTSLPQINKNKRPSTPRKTLLSSANISDDISQDGRMHLLETPVRSSKLRKAVSEIEIASNSRKDNHCPSEKLHRAVSYKKSHYSTSDIPDAIYQESLEPTTNVWHEGDSKINADNQSERKHVKKKMKSEKIPLTERVKTFYDNFSKWMEESTRPKVVAEKMMIDDLAELAIQTEKQKERDHISLPPIK